MQQNAVDVMTVIDILFRGLLACGAVVTAIFAMLAYRQSSRSRAISAYRDLMNTIMASNVAIISDKDNLELAEKMMYQQDPHDFLVDMRMRWVAFGLLNSAEAGFICERALSGNRWIFHRDRKHGGVAQHHVKRLLAPRKHGDEIVEPTDIYKVLYTGGYDLEFSKYCGEIVPEYKRWADRMDAAIRQNQVAGEPVR